MSNFFDSTSTITADVSTVCSSIPKNASTETLRHSASILRNYIGDDVLYDVIALDHGDMLYNNTSLPAADAYASLYHIYKTLGNDAARFMKALSEVHPAHPYIPSNQ